MEHKILVKFMGRPIEKDQIPRILDKNDNDQFIEILREDMERYFGMPIKHIPEEALQRYASAPHINFALHEDTQIARRLYEPLELAKKFYSVGDFPAVFAMCGVVGEMLTLLLWKIKGVTIAGKKISDESEKMLLGESFENIPQKQRIRICRVFRWISNQQCKKLNVIRMKRNEMLHSWNLDFTKADEERIALQVLQYTYKVFDEIVDVKLENASSMKINPSLLSYIKNAAQMIKSKRSKK